MPPKRQQTSRLNSINLEFMKPTIKFEAKSLNDKYSDYKIEDCEDLEMEEETSNVEIVMSRTSLLILDYLQFKAARSIQRFVRGWLCRTQYQRQRMSAIIIQAQWRRYLCQRNYFHKVEDVLQQRIEEHFYQSAQKIQALWRGWYSRKYIHDQTHLLHMQGIAGEDLLYCVAFKLHHLLRTHQIPGIYSLRNSTAFSKVEQLLATLSIKNCNEHAREVRDYRENAINYAKKEFKKSKYGTEIPFSGPNINNLCVPKCMPLFAEKDADRKMARILQMYKDSSREIQLPKILQKKSKFSKDRHYDKSEPTTFCGDVVRSMKKWKIIKDNNLKVEDDVFEKPENVQHFLEEVESKLNLMQENCLCGQEYLKKSDRPKQKYQSNNDAKLTNSFTSEIVAGGMMPNKDSINLANHKVSGNYYSAENFKKSRFVDSYSKFLPYDVSSRHSTLSADGEILRNSVSTVIAENVYITENVKKSGTADNHTKLLPYEGSLKNSVPPRVSINLNNTNVTKKSGTADKYKKMLAIDGVANLKNVATKGILRNSVPIEVQRSWRRKDK